MNEDRECPLAPRLGLANELALRVGLGGLSLPRGHTVMRDVKRNCGHVG
jgi:hypothetical protein